MGWALLILASAMAVIIPLFRPFGFGVDVQYQFMCFQIVGLEVLLKNPQH
jgi:hypothetical protein